jgi:hypothetical protein
MKTIKSSLGVILGSPLVWIGGIAVLGAVFTYVMLWSGHLDWFARLTDRFYAGLFIGPFLARIFLAGICLMVCGLILGILRFVSQFASKSMVAPAFNTSLQSTQATSTEKPKPSRTRCRGGLIGLILFFSLLIIVSLLSQTSSYRAADPCQIRVVDDKHQPVCGLRMIRTWGFSLEHYGTEERLTDLNGIANFDMLSVEISLLDRLELGWMPKLVRSWYPGQDSLPITVFLPANLSARFDSSDWRPVVPGDPSAVTNKFGVFVRYARTYFPVNQSTRIRIPLPQNSVGIGFPEKTHEVELQVSKNSLQW